MISFFSLRTRIQMEYAAKVVAGFCALLLLGSVTLIACKIAWVMVAP